MTVALCILALAGPCQPQHAHGGQSSTFDSRRGGHALALLPPEPIGDARAWLCIHSKEGAWNDTGDPYWGGLQMDRGFMRTYGSDMIRRHHGGLADTWTPREQMVAAERARRVRGYTPWPATARACGLL